MRFVAYVRFVARICYFGRVCCWFGGAYIHFLGALGRVRPLSRPSSLPSLRVLLVGAYMRLLGAYIRYPLPHSSARSFLLDYMSLFRDTEDADCTPACMLLLGRMYAAFGRIHPLSPQPAAILLHISPFLMRAVFLRIHPLFCHPQLLPLPVPHSRRSSARPSLLFLRSPSTPFFFLPLFSPFPSSLWSSPCILTPSRPEHPANPNPEMMTRVRRGNGGACLTRCFFLLLFLSFLSAPFLLLPLSCLSFSFRCLWVGGIGCVSGRTLADVRVFLEDREHSAYICRFLAHTPVIGIYASTLETGYPYRISFFPPSLLIPLRRSSVLHSPPTLFSARRVYAAFGHVYGTFGRIHPLLLSPAASAIAPAYGCVSCIYLPAVVLRAYTCFSAHAVALLSAFLTCPLPPFFSILSTSISVYFPLFGHTDNVTGR